MKKQMREKCETYRTIVHNLLLHQFEKLLYSIQSFLQCWHFTIRHLVLKYRNLSFINRSKRTNFTKTQSNFTKTQYFHVTCYEITPKIARDSKYFFVCVCVCFSLTGERNGDATITNGDVTANEACV